MSEPQNGSASVGLTLQVRSVTEETIDRLSRQIEEGYDVDVLRRRNGWPPMGSTTVYGPRGPGATGPGAADDSPAAHGHDQAAQDNESPSPSCFNHPS